MFFCFEVTRRHRFKSGGDNGDKEMGTSNGIVIWKRLNGIFEVRYYDCGDYPSIEDMDLLDEYVNISDALKFGMDEETEYGISYVEEKEEELIC